MPTNLPPIVARAANKHSSAVVGDKLAASWVLSAQAGNAAVAGSDGGVFVPAPTAANLPSMQLNAAAYTFTTETGWIFRTNPANATFTFPASAGIALGTEYRIVNRSAAIITLAGGAVRGLDNVVITTIPPFSSLWFYRANDSTFSRTI